MDSQIEWLKSLAAKIHPSIIAKQSLYQIIETHINLTIDTFPNSVLLDQDKYKILQSEYKYIIFSDSAHSFANTLIDNISKYEDKHKTGFFKPITLIIKLSRQEYSIDFNSDALIYLVQSECTNEFLFDLLTFRNLSNVKMYFSADQDFISKVTNNLKLLVEDTKKGYSTNNKLPYNQIRKEFINKLLEKIQFDKMDSNNNIIIASEIENAGLQAIDIIYSKNIMKDMIFNMMKNICSQHYNSYKIHLANHQNLYALDFRLKKASIYLESGNSKIYLCHLYNLSSYDPLPCYFNPKHSYYTPHVFIKLRFALLNYYATTVIDFQKKRNSTMSNYKLFLLNLIITYIKNILKSYESKPVIWIGMYRDEDYDKIKYNQHRRYQPQ